MIASHQFAKEIHTRFIKLAVLVIRVLDYLQWLSNNDFITWNLKNLVFVVRLCQKYVSCFVSSYEWLSGFDRENMKSVFFIKLKGCGCGCSFFKHQRFRAKTLQQGWSIYIYVQVCIQVFQRVIYGTQTHRWRGEGLQKSYCENWNRKSQGNWSWGEMGLTKEIGGPGPLLGLLLHEG